MHSNKEATEEKATVGTKRIRDETQTSPRPKGDEIVEAAPRLAAHITTPAKFNKCAEMAYQLLVSGRVTPHNSAAFFQILEAGVTDIKTIRTANLRAAYQRLYAAAVARIGRFPPAVQPTVRLWEVRVIAQLEILSDDTNHFQRAAKQAPHPGTPLRQTCERPFPRIGTMFS